MFNLLYKQLDESDLQSLIGTSNENQSLDFKELAYPKPNETLPSDQRTKAEAKWRLDLSKDVSAFANANGGLIICGIVEQGGFATELRGLPPELNVEREIARLEQAAWIGIEPPVTSMNCYPVSLANGNQVIIIRVPRSFAAPHRVKESGKFHIRRSNRNDEMTINELRAAFNLSDSLLNRIRDFRKSRVEALAKDSIEHAPVLLSDGIQTIVHLIPLAAFEVGAQIDLSSFKLQYPAPWVVQNRLELGRFNLDGYAAQLGVDSETGIPGYVQIFRTGMIEGVDIRPYGNSPHEDKTSFRNIETGYIYLLKKCIAATKNLNLQLLAVILFSINGLKGKTLVHDIQNDYGILRTKRSPVKNHSILLPDILLENHDTDLYTVVKPIFDILWNIGGYERSFSYTENGIWMGMRD